MEYRRQRVLVQRGFQLKFALFVSIWVLILSGVYPLVIASLFSFFTSILESGTIESAKVANQQMQSQLTVWIILFQIVFTALTFVISIFMSHRVAGPIFKFMSTLRLNENGRMKAPVQFRKNDHFHELAELYNLHVADIREKIGSAQAELSKLEERLPQDMKHVAKEIESIRLKIQL